MRKNRWIQEYGLIILTGVVVGLAALILTAAGNPKNMGFCIACFLRDIAGALGCTPVQCAVHPARDHRHRPGCRHCRRSHPGVPGPGPVPLPPAGFCWVCSS